MDDEKEYSGLDLGLVLEEGNISPDQIQSMRTRMGDRFDPFCDLIFSMTDETLNTGSEEQVELIKAFKRAVSQ